MPFNGSGTFLRVRSWIQDAAANIRIRADRHDSEDDNFAQGLSQCITKDGQTTITANLPMANYRHTNVGAANAVNQYARYDQLQLGKAVWAAAGGTADAITASYSPNTTAPVDGQLYYVRASAANATTTPTFSPDGTTAQIITKYGAEPLVAGDISGAGHELILRYRLADTKYELLNPAAQSNFDQSISINGTTTESAFINLFEDTDNGTNKVKLKAPDLLAADVTVTLPAASGTLLLESQVPVLRNYIDGYTLSTAGASTTMTIAAGQVADSTTALYINNAASINKTTAAWAVGSGNGGIDTGTIADNTWYRFYAIYRSDTGVSDVIFSANGTSPTLPANYTHFAPLWWARTNGSAQWIRAMQTGDEFDWYDTVSDVNANSPGTSAVTRTLTVPPSAGIIAKVQGGVYNSGGMSLGLILSALDVADEAPTAYNTAPQNSDILGFGVSSSVLGRGVVVKNIRTNGSSQIRSRTATGGAESTVTIRTTGWIDKRI